MLVQKLTKIPFGEGQVEDYCTALSGHGTKNTAILLKCT
jgi:hypothetical protein